MKDIRQKMLRGEVPAVCSQCASNEKMGNHSLRKTRNHMFKHLIPDILRDAAVDGTAPPTLSHLDLRFGNSCNLRCRMCNPQASRLLIPEWKKMFPDRYSPQEWSDLTKADWFESPQAWDIILSTIDKVERIYLTGGEPMLIKAQYRLLEHCIEHGHAHKITLDYNTNATTVDPQLFAYWKHFKRVQLYLSIDGIGPLNEYIRFPAKWTAIEDVLETYQTVATQNGNMSIQFSVTVQAYNVLRIHEITSYIKQAGLPNLISVPDLNILNRPRHFNVDTLPPHFKVMAIERLTTLLNQNLSEMNPDTTRFLTQVNGLMHRLQTVDTSEHFHEFVGITRFFDKSRNQSLADILPELS